MTIFLEHKNSEPAMKILMRNIGMTLYVIHSLREQGLDNVKVNMDWQHLIMNGENLAEYAALLAAEGLLGHQHANSGWGTFDDDNMVGATAFMETLELAVELRRAGLRRERRAARLRPLPVHRGSGRRRQALGAAVAVHRLGRGEASTTTGCARRSRRRTPSGRTSSSTPRSAREASARDDRASRSTRDGARRARSTAGCSGSRSATCCRRSTRRFIWYRVGGDLELHLMLIDEEPPVKPHLCLVVDDDCRVCGRGSRRRASRRTTRRRSSAARASPAATRSAT